MPLAGEQHVIRLKPVEPDCNSYVLRVKQIELCTLLTRVALSVDPHRSIPEK